MTEMVQRPQLRSIERRREKENGKERWIEKCEIERERWVM